MQIGRRYRFIHTLRWTRKYIFRFIIWASIPVVLHHFFPCDWLRIPWQPISLIGIAVAFYLGFKNNSSYDRLWEARKIWGGIVNVSRSFTVMAKYFVNNDEALDKRSDSDLKAISKKIVHRHVAWLWANSWQLRKVKSWEHQSDSENEFRKMLDTDFNEGRFDKLRDYISEEELNYVLSKGNRASHLLGLQTADLMRLRQEGVIEHFRHLEMQGLVTEMYTLQGKAERIKNFPFPRQYASVNYYFVVLFILLLPFGMIDVFGQEFGALSLWLSIPFTVVCSWVFWLMEMIGDYSENPFEGLFNDVPITNMVQGIEKDIRQMLDEDGLVDPGGPLSDMNLIM